MWMMGCGSNNMINGSNHEINTSHHDPSSLINQRLKRLIPKPTSLIPTPIILNHPSDHLLTFNQHLAERYNKDVESQQHQLYASAKTRWNPTAAQLHALENIYRHGTRTPSSEQIQHIANQLRQYGEIEGKNVFYWFQNHKARERQKRRRVSESSSTKNCLVNVMEDQQAEADDTPDSECRRTSFEVGQTNNNWSLHNSNFTTHSEEPVLIHREAAAVVVVKSKSADGWIELENRESPERRKHVREKITMEEKIKSIRRKKITSSNYREVNQSQTLELFPLRSDDELNCVRENHSRSITNFSSPIQFFEFL